MRIVFIILAAAALFVSIVSAQHHTGGSCISCHATYALAGTVFADYDGVAISKQARLSLHRLDGSSVTLSESDDGGRIHAPVIESGRYLVRLGALRSRTWHVLPDQRDCNVCHIPGGNCNQRRTKHLTPLHTEIPQDNDCARCHHFPASMATDRLATPGTLNAVAIRPATQGSAVVIRGMTYPFDPTSYDITTLRPDVFAEGAFSLFDVLLAVGRRNGHSFVTHWDEECQTHFIDSVDGVAGDFWYHFSYDAGSGTTNELKNKRQIRWDELLYQPGAWVQLVMGEALTELKQEYREEIQRERQFGHVVPLVRITINPSNYEGNPPESHRITVSRTWHDVAVTSHGIRERGRDSLYRSREW